MRYSTWCASLLGLALLLIMSAGSAQAQASRTWVSGVGDDANPCIRTAPCKTFAGAFSRTAVGGEINCLDPGGFGAVTITKSITIRCDHVEAGVLVSGTNGITINAGATDRVVLEGLDIEGSGTGIHGINVVAGGKVYVIRCSIRHFSQNGVNLVGTSGARAFVENSIITNNAGGINVGTAGVANVAFVRNTLFDNNTSFASQTANTSTLVLIGSTLVGSPSSIITTAGAAVISYGNNVLRNAGAPTLTLPLQ